MTDEQMAQLRAKATAEGQQEYERLQRQARQIEARTGLSIHVPPPYDFEAALAGRDPLPDAFRKATGKSHRAIGVACRLGPACETWAIAMDKLVGER